MKNIISKKIKSILLLASLVVSSPFILSAQYAHFVERGVITYEKSVNMYVKMEKQFGGGSSFGQQALEQFRKTQPQFTIYENLLYFDVTKTLYKPSDKKPAASSAMSFFGTDPSIDMGNIIFTDLIAKQSQSQKSVYEETFLITDAPHKIDWKITDERREIAGYSCRRANALVLDSIYVVAFYTDQIPVSGGPESFTGLPGMILGLALPHENVTWFASKVEERPVAARDLAAPTRGRAVDRQGLRSFLESSFKAWGDRANDIYKAVML